MPASGGPFPIVLVIQEIFGVHEHIRDVCRRLAKLGYLAIAPELYARQGDVSQMADVQQIIREVVSKVPDAQVMSYLDATVAFAKESGKGDTSRLGITGFCWGGRIVWLYAAYNPNLKAGVAWYGRLVGDASPLMPKHPVDLATELKAPVLGLYGGADPGIPVSTIEQMKQACQAAAKTCEFAVYPDAPPDAPETELPSGSDRLRTWQRLPRATRGYFRADAEPCIEGHTSLVQEQPPTIHREMPVLAHRCEHRHLTAAAAITRDRFGIAARFHKIPYANIFPGILTDVGCLCKSQLGAEPQHDPLFAQARKANNSRKVSSGASSCSVCPQSSARPRTSSAFSRQVSSTS